MLQQAPRDAIVLFGGSSDERRVSVASAQHLTTVLPAARFWFWAADDQVVQVEPDELARHQRPFETDFAPSSGQRWPTLVASLSAVGAAALLLALHGGNGEDGTVQALFEAHGVPFTGSGSQASALAMDKPRAKLRVSEHGVLTAQGTLHVQGPALAAELAARFESEGPLVVKPAASGSSVGLSFIHQREDLARAASAVEPGAQVLVERWVQGRELTVGVVESATGEVSALPCSEVRVASGRSFDYEGKYLGKGTQELTPADVAPDVFRACQEVAVTCHRALGCRGYSRTDVIVGEGGPVFLETNTLPGLTRASFIPEQLRVAGIPFREFLDVQLDLAWRRARGG